MSLCGVRFPFLRNRRNSCTFLLLCPHIANLYVYIESNSESTRSAIFNRGFCVVTVLWLCFLNYEWTRSMVEANSEGKHDLPQDSDFNSCREVCGAGTGGSASLVNGAKRTRVSADMTY